MSVIQFGAILAYAWFTIGNARTLNTECVNVVGPNSGYTDDAYSTATCAAGYTLVSCGIDTTVTPNIDGAKIEGEECRAFIGSSNAQDKYVRAVARCCKLHSSAQCSNVMSVLSGTADDATATAICASNQEILTGCSAYTPWRLIDGSHPGSKSGTWMNNVAPTTVWFERSTIDGANPLRDCTAWNGALGNGIYANGRCCSYSNTDIKLQCGVNEGYKSGPNDNDISEVGCPSDYYLSGCSSYTAWKGSKSWYTTDLNKCRARTSNSQGVWPYALCCREIDSSCDMNDAGKYCESDGDCTGCMVCCQGTNTCHIPPATPI